jgi:hypothetical protein
MASPGLAIDRIPPSTASYIFATAILAGVTGYFIGQGSSLNIFRSPQNADDESDLEDEEEEEDDEEEDDTAELATFEGNHDEVKLVLVVRTDLGMGKGFFFLSPTLFYLTFFTDSKTFSYYRQNRRAMLPRNPRVLQILPIQIAQLAHSQTLGAWWPGQGCVASENRGRHAVTTSPSSQSGSLRARDSGCWTHADCQWQQDGARCVGPEEYG